MYLGVRDLSEEKEYTHDGEFFHSFIDGMMIFYFRVPRKIRKHFRL